MSGLCLSLIAYPFSIPQKRSNASIPGAADTSDLDVSKPKEVVLECTADGWPLPEFQVLGVVLVGVWLVGLYVCLFD